MKNNIDKCLDNIKKLNTQIKNGEFIPEKWRTCDKKAQYETEYEAIDACYKAKRERPSENKTLTYYNCSFCNHWHLGHRDAH